MSSVELMSIALMSAPDGVSPKPATLTPSGYQPSSMYWRTSAAAAAACGVAQLVPQTSTTAPLAWSTYGPAPQAVPTSADRITHPTAQTSGLRRPSAVGPGLPEPSAISFGSSRAQATQMAFFAVPGGPCSPPVFPAEPRTT